ncbi:MAG: hypothetical protein QG622_3555 [Actinomycetota bacterium]|nr:hypothetical protein [Actinomycetota bacterium]
MMEDRSWGVTRGGGAQRRPTIRMIVIRIGVPIVALLVGALLVLFWAGSRIFDFGDFSWICQIVMFFVVAGVCGFFFFWSSWPWTGMIAAGLIFFSVMAAESAIWNTWLEQFSETGVCQVTIVDKRTYQEWVTDSDNGGGHNETRVVYRHHLQCPPGGPSEFSRSRIVAHNGESLPVVWDRIGWVHPLAASERRSTGESWRALLLIYGIATLVLLAEALIDLARYPKSSGWAFGGRGYMEGSFMHLAEGR